METTLTMVEITVKPEPMESENAEENEQNGYNQQTEEVKEDELWIKPEPLEDESQDFNPKEEDQGTLSENDATLDEEALNDECNRNRQSNAPSRKQILVFLDFLNEHRELANCMLRGARARAKAQLLWEGIAERLNTISGCIKTTQQWQRPKPQTPKQPQEVLVESKPSKPGPVNITLEPQPVITPEWIIPQPEIPRQPNISPRKPYTPRKTESLRKEASRKSDIPQSKVPPTPVIPPDASKPPDDLFKPVVEKQNVEPPSPSISDPSSPLPTQPELNRQGRVRLRACLDPYTKKFIHLEEERLKNDDRRNTELSEIRLSLQQGTAELAGIRTVMQEMLGLMQQMTEWEEKKNKAL